MIKNFVTSKNRIVALFVFLTLVLILTSAPFGPAGSAVISEKLTMNAEQAYNMGSDSIDIASVSEAASVSESVTESSTPENATSSAPKSLVLGSESSTGAVSIAGRSDSALIVGSSAVNKNIGVEIAVPVKTQNAYISLQYFQEASFAGMLKQLNTIPNPATDYADVISPSWFTLTGADGSITNAPGWDEGKYSTFSAAVHARKLKIMPLINSSWSTTTVLDAVLTDQTAQTNLINKLAQAVQSNGLDGIVIDLEFMEKSLGPNFSEFVKAVSTRLHKMNKTVIVAVMSRTSGSKWVMFDYASLANSADYLHVMTYDYSYENAGPIAPIAWMKNVLNYTYDQGVDMRKVLLGIPYYGRDWGVKSRKSVGLSAASALASFYETPVMRLKTTDDTVGTPYLCYSDTSGLHEVHYEDALSWEAKLRLMQEYGLGGIGAWSLYWVTDIAPAQLFPVLSRYLR